MSCIIEFTGKPGSGKSHASMALLNSTLILFPEKQVKALFSSEHAGSGRFMKIGVLCYTLSFHFTRFFSVYYQLAKALADSSKYRFISSFVNALYLDFRLRNALRKYDVVILDQGFIQLCWANLDQKNLERIKSVLIDLYSPYMRHRLVQVHVVASREIFESGLQMRKDLIDGAGYRFKNLDNGLMKRLTEATVDNNKFSAIEIFNDVDGEVDIVDVIASINEYVHDK
ncbi:hypothetical protein [Halomonas rhizosphaerae]|uniref:ATP-binding protein n=1 Tax=Halomonas rhizosphaerae TaxID=3043296 RepID=A0ABT6V1T1_9GAMM|nr:hypothetical protein [Halomonas rhizosphaerae]MDI5891881.1 hypothetical protein [Halomonas rhizosphaerae]